MELTCTHMHQIVKAISRKNNKTSDSLGSDFKVLQRPTVNTLCVYVYAKTKDQQNRIESPEINPGVYGQCIQGNGDKSIQWGTGQIILGKLNCSTQKNKTGP